MNVSEESTPKCWMDKRLVIKPWKVELVQRYFTNPRSQVPVVKLERKERSNGADVNPPLGDPPKAAPLMHGVQDQEGISSSSSTTSSPVSSVSISRPQLISKMKKPQGKDDVSSSRSKPVQVQSRPRVVLDKRQIPNKKTVQDEKDQGRNCVSVVLKSGRGHSVVRKSSHGQCFVGTPADVAAPLLHERIRVVENLSSKYPVKYEHKNENPKRGTARLDFCFHSAKNARLFFGDVNDLNRSGELTLKHNISVLMFSEESLGRFGLIFLLLSVDLIVVCRLSASTSPDREGSPDSSVSRLQQQHFQEFS